MALVILAIFLVGLILIATETLTHINKAAVAMFAGVTCWLIYIVYGNHFVNAEYHTSFLTYLGSRADIPDAVKAFVAERIFPDYVASAANIVLFLLATTSIAEVLSNNGCFDFIAEWLRTRHPQKLMWMLALITFILSANLDNLTTVVLMFSIVYPLLQNDKLRRIYCTVIVIAANCGGAITVIGDLTSLQLWTKGLVEPTPYFLVLILPVVIALTTILLLLRAHLPARVEFTTIALPYRGDDTLLTRSQRLLMLFVGIGGLWFIPTFHRLTALPPFLGALCVLALLWIVNELCNRQLMGSDRMVGRRLPMALQYANLQNLLFFIGLTLMFGAVTESGLPGELCETLPILGDSDTLLGVSIAFLSSLFGNIPMLIGGISVFADNACTISNETMDAGGTFWPLLSYTTALGGTLLPTGTVTGIMLMRMEGQGFGWYLKHITPKILIGLLAGYIVLTAVIWFS